MNEEWFNELKAAAREVIQAEKTLRANPQSWLSSPPNPDTVEGRQMSGRGPKNLKPAVETR